MRVVIDTNVVISSFRGGNPKAILQMVDRGEIIMCISPSIIEEYVRVLHRLGIEKEKIERFLFYFENATTVIVSDRTIPLHIVEKDPDDDKFIECAVVAKALYIITGDKALLEVGSYNNISIVTPKEFLILFKDEPRS